MINDDIYGALSAFGMFFVTPLLLTYLTLNMPRLLRYLLINIPVYNACKNPLVNDNNEDRYNEWLCRNNGCITMATHYAYMPQATCKRCGSRNSCAALHINRWGLPDRYDRSTNET